MKERLACRAVSVQWLCSVNRRPDTAQLLFFPCRKLIYFVCLMLHILSTWLRTHCCMTHPNLSDVKLTEKLWDKTWGNQPNGIFTCMDIINKIPIMVLCKCKTERCCRAVNTPASYSGEHGFKSRPSHWLSWLRGFVFFLSTFRRMPW
jgi:hypothetical protein